MERFTIEEYSGQKGRAVAFSLATLGVLTLIIAWCAGGYLFTFTIGVLVGLIVAYRIAVQYLAGILGG